MTAKPVLAEVIGWYGAIALLGAFALHSFGFLRTGGVAYSFLNLTGGIGIMVISLRRKAYQPAAVNIIWSLIAAFSLVKAVS